MTDELLYKSPGFKLSSHHLLLGGTMISDVVFVLALSTLALGAQNGLAITPQMGTFRVFPVVTCAFFSLLITRRLV
jgi:hypothetical protein